MTRFVALLRGINLGSRNVKMDRLREIFRAMGFSDVETYIASGNVIFSVEEPDEGALATRIEEGLRKGLGYEVAVILRTGPEIVQAARYDPFREIAGSAELPLNVAFMREAPPEEMRENVLALRTPEDEFHVHGREIYWLARLGIGRSTASRVFEKLMAGRGTVRNINTVRKIAERYFST